MQSINLHTRSLGRALKSLKSLPCEGWVNLGYATTHGSNLLVGRAAVEALEEIHAVAVATRDGLDLVRAAAVDGSTWTGTLVRPHTSVGQLHPRTTRFGISLNGCTSGAAAR